jgi:hypothetical protein
MTGFTAGALLAGCGPQLLPDDRPPPTPSAADVRRAVGETRAPAYWLGPSFQGSKLSEIRQSRAGHVFSYGRFYCDPGSGCSAPESIVNSPRDVARLGLVNRDLKGGGRPSRCWRKLGRAVFLMVGCDFVGFPQEAFVFTGSREIFLGSFDDNRETPAYEVARHLKPLNASAPWPLPAPRTLSCREISHVGSRYRARMPRSLRPRRRC